MAKTCTTSNCNNAVFSKGLCYYHRERKPIARTAPKVSKDKFQAKKDLGNFFAEMSNWLPAACENCGERFGYVAPHLRYWYVAHILPKSDFESIATDENNILFLNPYGCCCHGQYDGKGAEYRSKMPVYQKVLKRFELLKSKLTEREIMKAEEYLNII